MYFLDKKKKSKRYLYVPDDSFDVDKLGKYEQQHFGHVDQAEGDVGSVPGAEDNWNVISYNKQQQIFNLHSHICK